MGIECRPKKEGDGAHDGERKTTKMVEDFYLPTLHLSPPEFKTYVFCPFADHLSVKGSSQELHPVG